MFLLPDRPSLQANRVFQSDASLQQVSTLSHLENQLATSLAVKSASDYRFWLETYVRYLVQEGDANLFRLCTICKVFLILTSLYGSSYHAFTLQINSAHCIIVFLTLQIAALYNNSVSTGTKREIVRTVMHWLLGLCFASE